MRERAFVALCLIFVMGWMISEWEERQHRSLWEARLDDFMTARGTYAGNRFTSEDGKKLEARIKALEDKLGEYDGRSETGP